MLGHCRPSQAKDIPPMQSPPAPTHPHSTLEHNGTTKTYPNIHIHPTHHKHSFMQTHTPSPWEVYEPPRPGPLASCTPSCYRQLSAATCNLPAQWSPPQKQTGNKGGMLSQGSAVRETSACFAAHSFPTRRDLSVHPVDVARSGASACPRADVTFQTSEASRAGLKQQRSL